MRASFRPRNRQQNPRDGHGPSPGRRAGPDRLRTGRRPALSRVIDHAIMPSPNVRTPDTVTGYTRNRSAFWLFASGLRAHKGKAHLKRSAGKHRVGLIPHLAKGFDDSQAVGELCGASVMRSPPSAGSIFRRILHDRLDQRTRVLPSSSILCWRGRINSTEITLDHWPARYAACSHI